MIWGSLWKAASGYAESKTREKVKSTPAQYRVAARDLLREFMDNRQRADSRYKHKVIEVTGSVDHIGNAMGAPYIALDPEGSNYVQCLFGGSARADLAQLNPADEVKVKGWVVGWSISVVALDGCVLLK